MEDVIDDSDGFASPARRRVSAYVAAPIVLACGLIGYGLSLVFPLNPVPAAATAIVPSHANVEPAPAAASQGRPDAAPRQTAAPQPRPPAANDTPASPGKSGSAGTQGATTVAPTVVPTSAPVPARAVETGSVAETPQAPSHPVERTAARPAEAPEAAAAAEPEAAGPRKSTRVAREVRRKRIRRLTRRYYRPQSKQAAGPFEALFPALVK